MDLIEKDFSNTNRHPWEIARAVAALKLLKKYVIGNSKCSVLDVGCGDCYFGERLFKAFDKKLHYSGIDSNISDGYAAQCEAKGMRIFTSREQLKKEKYDLLLFMDVLEHIDNEKEFLGSFVNENTHQNSTVFIAVPAFSIFYSAHDEFLKHKRRYSKGELIGLAKSCGLAVERSGYYFFGLLIARSVMFLYEKLINIKKPKGVGKPAGRTHV